MRTALRRNGCALTKRAIAISQLAITRYTYSKISNFKMAEQGEEFEQGIAEGTVFGRRKVFVIHDGLEEAKLDKICMESDGRHYFDTASLMFSTIFTPTLNTITFSS